MNSLTAQTYAVQLFIQVAYTMRAESLADVRTWAEDVMANERDHLHMMIDGSDADWIIVKEVSGARVKDE